MDTIYYYLAAKKSNILPKNYMGIDERRFSISVKLSLNDTSYGKSRLKSGRGAVVGFRKFNANIPNLTLAIRFSGTVDHHIHNGFRNGFGIKPAFLLKFYLLAMFEHFILDAQSFD